jgi:hypothetical protein
MAYFTRPVGPYSAHIPCSRVTFDRGLRTQFRFHSRTNAMTYSPKAENQASLNRQSGVIGHFTDEKTSITSYLSFSYDRS